MENKYGVKDVVELFIFDEDGKLVTTLDSLQESKIVSNKENNFIFVRDALLDIDLLRFQQDSETNSEINDFKTILQQIKGTSVVVKQKREDKKCKIIAKSTIRNRHTGEDAYIYYEIPEATITSGFEIENNNYEPSAFDVVFNINPNASGVLFEIHGF